MTLFVFFGTLLGASLIILPLWPKIERVLKHANEVGGQWICAWRYPQPLSNIQILDKRDGKHTYRPVCGGKRWCLVLLHEDRDD